MHHIHSTDHLKERQVEKEVEVPPSGVGNDAWSTKRTTEQKTARRHGKEGGNHLEQDGVRQTKSKALVAGYIVQCVDKALVKCSAVI